MAEAGLHTLSRTALSFSCLLLRPFRALSLLIPSVVALLHLLIDPLRRYESLDAAILGGLELWEAKSNVSDAIGLSIPLSLHVRA